MIQKLLLLILLFPLFCNAQKKGNEYQGDVNYKEIFEIDGLIYLKADTTLVTGKVIRYNKKNEPKKYILVLNGKLDNLGWKNVVESNYIESFEPIFKKTNGPTGENQLAPYDELTRKDFNRINELNRKNELELVFKEKRGEINKETFGEKPLMIKLSEVDSVRDGLWEEYYDNGQLRSTGNYIGRKKDGLWQEYYENGNLENVMNFKEGKKVGLLKNYYSDGQLKGRINYKEGKEHGMIELYHQNGKLMLEGFFKEANQISVWKYYDEDGKLINIETFDN